MKRHHLLAAAALCALQAARAQTPPAQWNTPGAGNPFIPGYFADPTVRKFGDTYYVYATTDGTGNGYGPAQVWASKDFVNWKNCLLNWPTTEVVWAPDVVRQPDGTYRYYYCTNACDIRVGESARPTGPWRNRLGQSEAVLVRDRFVHNAITLDPQLFRDDDGSEYLYFGTWGIYKGFGCGAAKLAADGLSFTDKRLIPNTEVTDFFEAPYVFKKDGTYYFTYSSGSCHDDTYRVQYAVSTDGPMGPYTYKGCILRTSVDGTVHGPGHHSILRDGEAYYIVYHRHNNPHAVHGFHRQVCMDKLEFDGNGDIRPVQPTHEGLVPQSLARLARKNTAVNLAYGARVEASSSYSEWFRPEYAVDDNNGTLWRAASCTEPGWLTVDLGRETRFNQVFTQFEYATFFYQYLIETSSDGRNWTVYADRRANTRQGSPMIDEGEARARYVRLTVTDTQKNGHFPAVWNIKVYNATRRSNPKDALPQVEPDEAAIVAGYPWIHEKDVRRERLGVVTDDMTDPDNRHSAPLIDLNADRLALGTLATDVENAGLPGRFRCAEGVPVVPKDGKTAFRFDGTRTLVSEGVALPRTMKYNAPYTVCAWVLNPNLGETECVAQFMPAGNDLATVELRNGRSRTEGVVAHNASFENAGAGGAAKEGVWQFWAVSFDGFNERVYCDGTLVSEKNIFLMLRPGGDITVGASAAGGNPFSGYLHSLQLYDRSMTEAQVRELQAAPSDYDRDKAGDIASLSPLRGKALRLSVEPIGDGLARAAVTGADGQPLKAGLCDYYFGSGADAESALAAAKPLSGNEALVGVDGTRTVFARVRDVFGFESDVLASTLKAGQTGWREVAQPIRAKAAADGRLRLESENRKMGTDKSENGPTEAVELDGDFIAVARVAGLTGAERRATPGYNEGGVFAQADVDAHTCRLVHLGVFPNYNCGNMLTVAERHFRPQYPNNKGWDYDPWLMLERRGSRIHARTSADGKVWAEMPGSPVERDDLPRVLKVGVYQATYTENRAAVDFDGISIYQRKP